MALSPDVISSENKIQHSYSCAVSIVHIFTPSNWGRKSNSNKNSNKNAPNETKERTIFIIDIPPRILANVMCPQLYI